MEEILVLGPDRAVKQQGSGDNRRETRWRTTHKGKSSMKKNKEQMLTSVTCSIEMSASVI
jgi:hypothetical protein